MSDTSPSPALPPQAGEVATDVRSGVTEITVWDLPLRIVHWSLAVAVSTSVLTGLRGGDWMRLHGLAGLAVVGLLAFRLVWGVIGTPHARFGQFLPTPATVYAYLRGRWQGLGHNPLGALAVFAMLALLVVQVVSGLFSNDDIAYAGPWAIALDDDSVAALTRLHRRTSNVVLALLGLHLAAIAWYSLVRRQRLVAAMLHGRKKVKQPLVYRDAKPAGLRGSAYALVLAVFVALLTVFAAANADLWSRRVETPAPAAGW